MYIKKDKREIRIRKIAYSLYSNYKNNGFYDDPLRDWIEAEHLYNNKIRYYLWALWQWISKFHYQIVAIFAIIGVFVNGYNVLVGWISTDLNTRPYVSVDMPEPIKQCDDKDCYYGKPIILKNTGKIPASNVLTRYYITTELDKSNQHGSEWFNKELGGFGSVSFIVPNATELEKGYRSLSPGAEYYYFEALSYYEGLKQKRKYWTHVKKVFFVDKNKDQLYVVYTYGEWDRNKDFRVPRLSTEKEVLKLLGEIKNKRSK